MSYSRVRDIEMELALPTPLGHAARAAFLVHLKERGYRRVSCAQHGQNLIG
jgi:hypothetical protein